MHLSGMSSLHSCFYVQHSFSLIQGQSLNVFVNRFIVPAENQDDSCSVVQSPAGGAVALRFESSSNLASANRQLLIMVFVRQNEAVPHTGNNKDVASGLGQVVVKFTVEGLADSVSL